MVLFPDMTPKEIKTKVLYSLLSIGVMLSIGIIAVAIDALQ